MFCSSSNRLTRPCCWNSMLICSKFAYFVILSPKPKQHYSKSALFSFLQSSWLKIICLLNKNVNFQESQHASWEQNKPRIHFSQDSGTENVIFLFHLSTSKALEFNRLLVNFEFPVRPVTEMAEQQKIMMVFSVLHWLGLD